MKKDCPSQRTYIATDDGYISASNDEDDDDGDSSEAAIDNDAMFSRLHQSGMMRMSIDLSNYKSHLIPTPS